MPKKSNRVNITDSLTVDVGTYMGSSWIHIRRKNKSVSILLKDFKKMLKKQDDIKTLAQKYKQVNKSSK